MVPRAPELDQLQLMGQDRSRRIFFSQDQLGNNIRYHGTDRFLSEVDEFPDHNFNLELQPELGLDSERGNID